MIHGSQKPSPSVSSCDGGIEESEEDDEEEDEDEEEGEDDDEEEGGYDVDGGKEEMSGAKRDTPVPPRFTKALIWT